MTRGPESSTDAVGAETSIAVDDRAAEELLAVEPGLDVVGSEDAEMIEPHQGDALNPWEERLRLAIRVISVDVAFPAIVFVPPYHSFTSRGPIREHHRETMIGWILAQAVDFDAPATLATLDSASPAHLEVLRSAQTPSCSDCRLR